MNTSIARGGPLSSILRYYCSAERHLLAAAVRKISRSLLRPPQLLGSAILAFCLLFCASATCSGRLLRANFEKDTATQSDTGYFTLSWRADAEAALNSSDNSGATDPSSKPGAQPDVTFQVQLADSPDFSAPQPVYAGLDTQTFVSGLNDGTRYYRVRAREKEAKWGPWSSPFGVEVRHHSLSLSLALFGLGAVVFGLTVAFLVSDQLQGTGAAHQRRETP